MCKTNNPDSQNSSHLDEMVAPGCEVKVLSFGHDSFCWEHYLGKYHINFICHRGVAHFSSSDVFYQIEPSDYVDCVSWQNTYRKYPVNQVVSQLYTG